MAFMFLIFYFPFCLLVHCWLYLLVIQKNSSDVDYDMIIASTSRGTFCSVTPLASCPKIKIFIPPDPWEDNHDADFASIDFSLSPDAPSSCNSEVCLHFSPSQLDPFRFLSISCYLSHISLLSLFPSTLSPLVFQINHLPFLLLSAGSAGITAAAKCRSVLPAADAAAADQQRPAAEPGGCATGKGACTFLPTLPTCLRFSVTSILRMLAIIVVWDTLSSQLLISVDWII